MNHYLMVPRTKLARKAYARRRAREDMETRARVAKAEVEGRFWADMTEARRIEAAERQKKDKEITDSLADTQRRLDRMMSGAGTSGMLGGMMSATSRKVRVAVDDPLSVDDLRGDVTRLAGGQLEGDDDFRIEDEDDTQDGEGLELDDEDMDPSAE